jgi:hypothetical protein
MTTNGHPQPLRSSPPSIFITAPVLHAFTTSQARIISPMIVIPGCLPITTTLTPSELEDLLPTLHIFIEPSFPGMAPIPAASVSHHGLEQALRWREADVETFTGMSSDLIGIVQIYQALAYLGNKPNSQNLQPLECMIRAAFGEGFLLEECQHLWALRHYPFTGKWIDLMFRRLVIEYQIMAADETADLLFWGRLEADEELRARYIELLSILQWIDKDRDLLQRFKCMQVRMAMEAMRARRMAKMMKPKRGRFCPCLDSIPE